MTSGVVAPHFTNFAILNYCDWVEVLPRSLRSMADAPNCSAEEKIGHSGRDDEKRKMPTREPRQECLCHIQLC